MSPDGVTVPAQRKVAQRYRALPLTELARLLASRYHDARFVAVAILVGQYRTASTDQRERLADFYLSQRQAINNWDLIAASAPHILEEQLATRGDARLLFQLATSPRLWDRRTAILASWAFLRRGDLRVTAGWPSSCSVIRTI